MIINGDKEYKENEFVHTIRVYTGKVDEIDTKKGKRKVKEYYMKEIPFEDFISLNLNGRGKSIPFISNGVINVNRYMFWFWTPIIGGDGVSLYTLLTEYCDDDTDICYPKVSELADRLGLTRPTVSSKLQMLEENNFIVILNRLNKLANNKLTSSVYKIRQTIPLLSIEQYNSLPEYLKIKHDKFMDKYGKESKMDFLTHDSQSTISFLSKNSERIVSKRDRERIHNIIESSKQSEYILVNLSPTQKMYCEQLHKELQKGCSKPAFDSFYADSICVYDELTNTVDFILNELGKEVIDTNSFTKDMLANVFNEIFNCNINRFRTYTFNDYIVKIERLK
jgi:DNA-binding transcriptional ArsR family regulator